MSSKVPITSNHSAVDAVQGFLVLIAVFLVIGGIGILFVSGVAFYNGSEEWVGILGGISLLGVALLVVAFGEILTTITKIEENTQATFKLIELLIDNQQSVPQTGTSTDSGIGSGKFLIWRSNYLGKYPEHLSLSDDTLYTKHFKKGKA